MASVEDMYRTYNKPVRHGEVPLGAKDGAFPVCSLPLIPAPGSCPQEAQLGHLGRGLTPRYPGQEETRLAASPKLPAAVFPPELLPTRAAGAALVRRRCHSEGKAPWEPQGHPLPEEPSMSWQHGCCAPGPQPSTDTCSRGASRSEGSFQRLQHSENLKRT